MWARLTMIEAPPERFDDGVMLVNNQIIPEAKKFEGFVGGYWMGDRDAGKMVAVTLWDSEEALSASEERTQQMRSQAADEMSASIKFVERYEVVAQA